MPYYLEESSATVKPFLEGLHLPMVNSEDRLQHYHDYFRLHAKDRVVLDVGAGLGLIGLRALEYGAAHVYMIEQNPETARILKQVAAAHPHGHKATVINADFHSMTRSDFHIEADVMVCEFWGPYLWNEGLHATHVKARSLFPRVELFPATYKTHFNIVEIPWDEHQVWPRQQLAGVNLVDVYKNHYQGYLIEHHNIQNVPLTPFKECFSLNEDRFVREFETVSEIDGKDVFLHLSHEIHWPAYVAYYRSTFLFVPEIRRGQKIKVWLNELYVPVFSLGD